MAPTVALSLFGLIAVGGVAFDYARMATLDTELQAAADQAALAAATQLDAKSGACSRAGTAANALVANQSRFANDGDGLPITIPLEADCDATGSVRFYQDRDKTTASDSNANAKFVEVTVDSREAFFALTPIVAALSSGALSATAFAGVSSAICKVPPVMMCNPAEPLSNTDESLAFDANSYIGKGLKLVTGNADTPGNFGFLETNFGNGASNLAKALGYNVPPGDCSPMDGVSTKTGMNAVVMDALNTRFDLSANGANTCPAGGTCSPSANVRKDLVQKNTNCTISNAGWQESAKPYRPAASTAPSHTLVTGAGAVDVMGHPRDVCHAVSQAGDCTNGRIGDGFWDRDAYFRVNYGYANQGAWTSATGLSATATRYQVYQWELANPGIGPANQSGGSAGTAHRFPVCRAPGITPGGGNVDRRRISAAVVNCHATNLHGHETGVPVAAWVDLFLVEPSANRKKITSPNPNTTMTQATDVYVEVIGETNSGAAGATAGQVVRHDVPYLIE